MLPYDGMTRTGSKGVSHFAEKTDKDPQRVAQLTGKRREKQPCARSCVEPDGVCCYTAENKIYTVRDGDQNAEYGTSTLQYD